MGIHHRRLPMLGSALLFVVALSSTTRAAVLFSRPPSAGGGLVPSAWVDPDGSDADLYAYDDFTLPSDGTITTVQWRGGYGGGIGGHVFDFTVTFFESIGGGSQPHLGNPQLEDTAPIYLAKYRVHGTAGETAAGVVGGVTMYDYAFTLPTPFVAQGGVKYWLRIEASQTGYPDWGVAVGTGGDGRHFQFSTGLAMFTFAGNDAAFTLLGAEATTTTTATLPTTTTTGSTTTVTGSTSTASTTSSTATTTTATSSTSTTTLPLCDVIGNAQLTLTHVAAPPGDDGLSFKGTFAVTPPAATTLDPVGAGLGLRLDDVGGPVLDVLVPPGAFDPVARGGWKVNRSATKWTYTAPKTAVVGGITKVVLTDRSPKAPGVVAFAVTGKAGSYAADATVTATVLVPAAGTCATASFPATPPASPSCVLKSTTLRCK